MSVEVQVKPKQDWYRRWGKRALDVVLASLGLMLTAPLALLIALAIRLTMGPPVLFRQVRPDCTASPS